MDETATKPEEKIETKPEVAQPEAKQAESKQEATQQAETKQEAKPAKRVPKVKTTDPTAAKTSKKKSRKKGKKVVILRGKRKESIARAIIREGKGSIRFNHASVNSIPNHYIRDIITEPVRYIGTDISTIDIHVSVSGGGTMGQAQAARTAIARGLVAYTEDENLKQKLLSIDRSMLVEDSRRVESKKYKGPKARARFQKSYR